MLRRFLAGPHGDHRYRAGGQRGIMRPASGAINQASPVHARQWTLRTGPGAGGFATDNKHGSAEHIKSLSEGQDTAILHTITMEIIAAAAVTALAQWLKK